MAIGGHGELVLKRIAASKMSTPLAVLALLAAALALVGCAAGNAQHGENTLPDDYAGTSLDGTAPDFRLTDHRGDTVALSDFRGRTVALAFLDPRCTDVCPLMALHFQHVRESLGASAASEVVFLAVNTNADATELSELQTATEKWGMDDVPEWHFLTGDAADLDAVWQAYYAPPAGEKPGHPEQVLHTDGVYVIDREGQQRWYISMPSPDAEGNAPSFGELLERRLREVLGGTGVG
jgi:cytochrome oxidase Cu insertion factor (SCO1/SenC/PrrC family)